MRPATRTALVAPGERVGYGPTPSPESGFPNPGTGSERARSDDDAVGTGQADVHNVPLDALRGDVDEFERPASSGLKRGLLIVRCLSRAESGPPRRIEG